MDSIIKFYKVNEKYGEFSNFARYPIKINEIVWPTSEHYFQAMKFESKTDQNEIRKAKTPFEAAKRGRDRKKRLRANWELIKDDVMRQALKAKFTQHDELKNLLINTGEAKLIEHTSNDIYWGDGGDGKGKNMLGQLLMELREELKT
jgi:ribA/ribD-fused uncharacterized protein